MDLNQQFFKYSSPPSCGFGVSGLGFRFMPGTQFARKPPIRTNGRLKGFRELREDIPELSEKEYQVSVERSLAEAATQAQHAYVMQATQPAQDQAAIADGSAQLDKADGETEANRVKEQKEPGRASRMKNKDASP